MNWTELLDKDPTGLLKKLTTKEKDPVEAHRKTILKNIEKSDVAYRSGKTRSGIHKQVGDFCRVEIGVGRNPKRIVRVNGNQFNMVPKEHYGAFLAGFREHVASGGLDNDIRNAAPGAALASTGRKRRTKAEMEALRAAGKAPPKQVRRKTA